MTTLSPARHPGGPRIARFPSEPKILCEALFASHLQSSQQPSDGDVRTAIDNTLRTLSAGQCAAWLAQEFGDHPETAITRMRWATEAVASAYEDAPESQTRCMPRASACIHREYAAHSPRAATKAAADAGLICCSTAGEIAKSGSDDANVRITAFGGERLCVCTAIARNTSRNLRAAGEQVADCPPGADERFITGGDVTERSLRYAAEVAQSGLVWITGRRAESVRAATDAACLDSVAALDENPPRGVLAFDRTARRSVVGEQGVKAEIDRNATIPSAARVRQGLHVQRVARMSGISGLHNQTLVVLWNA